MRADNASVVARKKIKTPPVTVLDGPSGRAR